MMNTRFTHIINQLAEDSSEYVETPLPNEIYNMGDDVFRRHKTFDREKFAELIVQECVEQVLTGIKVDPPQSEPAELAQILAHRIQQHFGVKG
jgi:hypothetical protein